MSEIVEQSEVFSKLKEDGTIDLLNSQNSGRVEILSGGMSGTEEGAIQVRLESVVHAHDARMVATTRLFNYEKHSLAYTVGMATTKVGPITQHLECSLVRSK